MPTRLLTLCLFMLSLPAYATGPLNDTGIKFCGDDTTNTADCRSMTDTSEFPRQDANHGRDAAAKNKQLAKIGAGNAGFDFTMLDADGNVLPSTAVDHSCVRDNVTKLEWEVKTNDGGLRDQKWTYTWYNSDATTNGGDKGKANGGACQTAGRCDTEKFVKDVNTEGLCGKNDWRLPRVEELLSIVDNGAPTSPSIDSEIYFPNTPARYFWSSSTYASYSGGAWHMDFNEGSDGSDGFSNKGSSFGVRLVRGGQ